MDDIPLLLPQAPVRFMDRFRAFIRLTTSHVAQKTYCTWVRGLIRFHGKRPPQTMAGPEVDAWLSYLANEQQVSVNIQKTSPNAVLVMYHQFLGQEPGKLQFTKTS